MNRRFRRRSWGLGTYAPADVTAKPFYGSKQAEGIAVQQALPPAPQAQPGVVPPPSSGPVYVPLSPWVTMPPDGEPFDPIPYVALPAQAANAVIIDFTVPDGRDGVIELFGNVVYGAGWTEGTGDLIWRILRDGIPARNYENIRASLGNVSNPVKLGLRIFEGERIQVTVDNAAAPNGIPAAGQIVSARFHGWFYPKSHDQQGWA